MVVKLLDVCYCEVSFLESVEIVVSMYRVRGGHRVCGIDRWIPIERM